ncbi:hypothetical protein BpHYR1_011903 [Brachionus plicatilis]|uniref:Uncharacterized protein n=1 Tax=Brachionus plicatilis TaxID=10195 RepID=A0A3M7PLF1_BRAPC|nr:hypothetical protein BpHYR1_011903 [Brachionus plicatilis]
MTNGRIIEFLADGKEQRVGCALDVLSPLCRTSAKYILCLKVSLGIIIDADKEEIKLKKKGFVSRPKGLRLMTMLN